MFTSIFKFFRTIFLALPFFKKKKETCDCKSSLEISPEEEVTHHIQLENAEVKTDAPTTIRIDADGHIEAIETEGNIFIQQEVVTPTPSEPSEEDNRQTSSATVQAVQGGFMDGDGPVTKTEPKEETKTTTEKGKVSSTPPDRALCLVEKAKIRFDLLIRKEEDAVEEATGLEFLQCIHIDETSKHHLSFAGFKEVPRTKRTDYRKENNQILEENQTPQSRAVVDYFGRKGITVLECFNFPSSRYSLLKVEDFDNPVE